MLHKRLKISALILIWLGLTSLQAQVSLNTIGGIISGSGGSASFSTGQSFCQMHIGTGGSVAEGVQQPYEIMIATVIGEESDSHITILAYPNPTSDFLHIIVESDITGDLYYQLLDMHGQLLQSKKITDKLTTIIMQNLIQSTYLVTVIQGNKKLKTFKIIRK